MVCIMVSRKGFQEGAKKFAAEYGISQKELRRPGCDEIIGSITTVVHANTFRALYLFDNDWVKEHDFNLDKIRSFYASFQFNKADYWKTAAHLPIETKDHFIRNCKGKVISSLEELEEQLPDNPEPGTEIIFPFEDGWVESRYWGPVRIREVKFEYESKVREITINLAADDFVEAILEDALGGKTNYVSKYQFLDCYEKEGVQYIYGQIPRRSTFDKGKEGTSVSLHDIRFICKNMVVSATIPSIERIIKNVGESRFIADKG